MFGLGKSDEEELKTEAMGLAMDALTLARRVIELKGELLAEKEAHLATKTALLEANGELAVLRAQNGGEP
jgi:hypothetical protein